MSMYMFWQNGLIMQISYWKMLYTKVRGRKWQIRDCIQIPSFHKWSCYTLNNNNPPLSRKPQKRTSLVLPLTPSYQVVITRGIRLNSLQTKYRLPNSWFPNIPWLFNCYYLMFCWVLNFHIWKLLHNVFVIPCPVIFFVAVLILILFFFSSFWWSYWINVIPCISSTSKN